MIQITVNKTCASVQNLEPITSGAINAKVQVSFDSSWDGLNKTAVFTNGAITKDVLESQWGDGNIIIIPHEVLTPNAAVKMGVYGYNFVNGIASAVPSVYVKLAKVRVGADPLADITTDPTLPVYAQLQWEIDHFEISEEQIAAQVQEYLEEHPIEIQPATASVLGGVKVGRRLSITPDGTLSADKQLPVPDGLDATGVTDMSTVIQTAINAGNVYLPDGTYRIDTPLTFSGNKQFICAGELVATGNGIVVYGQHNAIKVRKITATGHSCVVVGRGGYTEANVIEVNNMSGAIGFEVVDENSGTQYNKLTFEVISATLYGIYVHCTTNYISQTLIYSSLITGGAEKGVYLHTDNPTGDANHIVSSTIVINGAVEGIDEDGIAVEMVKSSYNSFKQLRVSEPTAGATKLKMSGVCGHNTFDVVGIDTNTIDVSELDSTSANNVIRGRINTASESRVANALWIDGQNGMTYAPLATHYTNDVNISPTTIDGTAYKVISMAANGYTTTELYLNSSNTAPTNYMLGREYSDLASACFGMPLVVRVPSVCKPTIYDADGNVIYDAHDGVPHALALIIRCVGSRYAASQKQWEVAETQTANDTIFLPASREWVDANYAEKDDLGELQKTALTATVTIAVADWEGGTTVTKNVTGVTATNIVFCDSSDPDVQCTAQGAGTLTFTASATPSATITVKVVILP